MGPPDAADALGDAADPLAAAVAPGVMLGSADDADGAAEPDAIGPSGAVVHTD